MSMQPIHDLWVVDPNSLCMIVREIAEKLVSGSIKACLLNQFTQQTVVDISC